MTKKSLKEIFGNGGMVLGSAISTRVPPISVDIPQPEDSVSGPNYPHPSPQQDFSTMSYIGDVTKDEINSDLYDVTAVQFPTPDQAWFKVSECLGKHSILAMQGSPVNKTPYDRMTAMWGNVQTDSVWPEEYENHIQVGYGLSYDPIYLIFAYYQDATTKQYVPHAELVSEKELEAFEWGIEDENLDDIDSLEPVPADVTAPVEDFDDNDVQYKEVIDDGGDKEDLPLTHDAWNVVPGIVTNDPLD